MSAHRFDFRKANRFLPHIALVAIGIGTANYVMYGDLNWVQWSLLSLSTSLIIGYSLVAIGMNRSWFELRFKPWWKCYITIIILFVLAGVLATEIEQIIRLSVFKSEPYFPFTAGKMYVFNGLISLILGFSFYQVDYSKRISNPEMTQSDPDTAEQPRDVITNVPVKQGESILLIPVQDIAYIEAYDNYSFVHDISGNKRLCDYALGFLEKRLNSEFSRVHRSYIVNERHINQIKSHINGRYVVLFDNPKLAPITTSKSYSKTIRRLIKIE